MSHKSWKDAAAVTRGGGECNKGSGMDCASYLVLGAAAVFGLAGRCIHRTMVKVPLTHPGAT
jgi:hypothetical protein